MWVDENGGADTEAGSSGGMTVHVDGEDYTAEVNYDIDHDGVNDTALIEHDDGSAQAFVDTNHDGVADEYAVLDRSGHVVQQARYDEASGQWVNSGHGGSDQHGSEQQTGTGGIIHADSPTGDVEVGPATVDTNHDGVNDTAVVAAKDGGTIAFTDKDGDGQADVAVEIDASGHSTTYEHTGHGQWTEESSSLVGEQASPAPDSDAAWDGGGREILEGVAKIDSGTGQWISPN